MEAETLTKVVEIAAKWAEQAEKRTGPFAGKSNWEVFEIIFKSLIESITSK